MRVCKLVYYTGRVQGVGFRYAAQRLAESFPVSGYVRNLRDGSVELVVAGAGDTVELFLSTLARDMAGYIEHARTTDAPPEEYNGFQIRY